MSCGKTPTRRQAHGKRRAAVTSKHAVAIGVHKISGGSQAALFDAGRGVAGGYQHALPRPAQKIIHDARKQAKGAKLSPAAMRRLKAWERRHPFTVASTAAWDKAHPFKFKDKPLTRAGFLKWIRAHPLKQDHPRADCQVKTRHAVSATRQRRYVAPGPFGPGTGPIPKTPPARSVKPAKARRASRPAKARRAG